MNEPTSTPTSELQKTLNMLADYRSSVDSPPAWEHGVRHIATDGWPSDRAHASLADARADLDTCGMNCHLIRRRPAQEAGKWEPFAGEADK